MGVHCHQVSSYYHSQNFLYFSLTTMDTQLGGCVAMRNLGFGEGK